MEKTEKENLCWACRKFKACSDAYLGWQGQTCRFMDMGTDAERAANKEYERTHKKTPNARNILGNRGA